MPGAPGSIVDLCGTDGRFQALAQPHSSEQWRNAHAYNEQWHPAYEANSLGMFSVDANYHIPADARAVLLDSIYASASYSEPAPPAAHARLEIQDYEREGGWSFDATGRTHYVPHGRIVQLADSEDGAGSDAIVDDSRTSLDALPPDAPPPPRPMQRTVELIPNAVLDRLPYVCDASPGYAPRPPSVATPAHHDYSHSPFDFEQNLASIETGCQDIVSLHAKFAALPAPNTADLALCAQIGDALHAVRRSLQRRTQILPEQWCLRSMSCQSKYDYRLMSLKRTLRRLHALSDVSLCALSANQYERVRRLLEQHHAKLSDLAAKFNATFDRLRIRHFSSVLRNVYSEIQHHVEKQKQIKEERRTRTVRVAQLGHWKGRRPSTVAVA
ncbi:hypothetical protein GGX14DRAFT_469420 [Mycena pura]|uniref:Uncharacterized protein n=1 Tax=Mycena pura TaxID=153505 RepID=A0AAD6V1S7_9AGAR|nr:hypothetical protein GGX14DRAFT_469420 [Mycena pura]